MTEQNKDWTPAQINTIDGHVYYAPRYLYELSELWPCPPTPRLGMGLGEREIEVQRNYRVSSSDARSYSFRACILCDPDEYDTKAWSEYYDG